MSLAGARDRLRARATGRRRNPGDVEAADYDESELDDLHVLRTPTEDRYSVGSGSDDEGEREKAERKKQGNGVANGKGREEK